MAAERVSDGELLTFKSLSKSVFPHETEIGQYFSTPPISKDPRNHCVPIYDALQVPDDDDLWLLVMPRLRAHDDPRFDTVGEGVEFFRQIFEGLQFMHQHHIAHRDATYMNIMMDARLLYPEGYHPFLPWRNPHMSGSAKHLTRTQRPVTYFLVDFGLSRKYTPEERPPLEPIIAGGDRSVPEFATADACDPFPVDVYTLGNMIKLYFLDGDESTSSLSGFEFMRPLVTDMTQADPSKRPTMDEVVERFEAIRKGLSSWKLRSRVVKSTDSSFMGFFRSIKHWRRRIVFIVKRVPPLPTPN
ncbi:hypothetical protein CCMSSC00406_0008487 [Pleurotus cornucopiae]|uniref:Uncharacterized protein n=1 Tax=Pleurotus cornucopiae TaxID=5321 RepID=A0ACB7IIQ1_PLECO|nr:hypothetical protein CCMSSC00406_0008487 [Pleurotus cornucopiae]